MGLKPRSPSCIFDIRFWVKTKAAAVITSIKFWCQIQGQRFSILWNHHQLQRHLKSRSNGLNICLNILSTFVQSRCWGHLTLFLNNVERCWDILRRVWLRLNFVWTFSQHFYCTRNVEAVWHAVSTFCWTRASALQLRSLQVGGKEDPLQFSEELQSKNKRRKTDSGKGGKVPQPKRWSSEEVDLLIDEFKKRSCLWDVFDLDYHSKEKRERAYLELEEVLGIKTLDIKTKVLGLRTQLDREMAKVSSTKSGQSSSENYKST